MEFLDSDPTTTANLHPLAVNTPPVEAQETRRLLRLPLGHQDTGHQDTALVPLEQITEIIKLNLTDILPVPEMPRCVLGICNWRGEMLWLIDFNDIAGYPSAFLQPSETQQVIGMVVQMHQQMLGMAVPAVSDVEQHDLQQLQPAVPGLFSAHLLPLVLGILPESCDPVLNLHAITQCPLWKNYQGKGGAFSV